MCVSFGLSLSSPDINLKDILTHAQANKHIVFSAVLFLMAKKQKQTKKLRNNLNIHH